MSDPSKTVPVFRNAGATGITTVKLFRGQYGDAMVEGDVRAVLEQLATGRFQVGVIVQAEISAGEFWQVRRIIRRHKVSISIFTESIPDDRETFRVMTTGTSGPCAAQQAVEADLAGDQSHLRAFNQYLRQLRNG